jgi:hypothetical protein
MKSIHAGQMFGEPAPTSIAGLDLEPVDQIDDVVKATAGAPRMQRRAIAMARWVLPVPVPPTSTALRCWASELVSDRMRLLLVDLGGEPITNDALRLVLGFDGRGHDLVEGGRHAVELELAHEVEQLSAFHQMVLLRLS